MRTACAMTGALIALAMVAPIGPVAAAVRPVVEAGLHVSTLDYDHEPQYWTNGWRPSFVSGAYVEIPLGGRLGLSPGLRYVQKGTRVDLNVSNVPVGQFRVVQDYLALPVALEVWPMKTRQIAFWVGPEVAYLVSAHLIFEGAAGVVPRSSYTDVRRLMDDFDFSVEIGAEYAFPLENHEGFFRVRYSEGLVGVAKASEWVSDWSTRGIQTVFGLRW